MPGAFFSEFKIISYDQVESTNAIAMQRLKKGEAGNGDIVITKYQIKGKGQSGNSWYSSNGTNLLLSIICTDLKLEPARLPMFNMLISLAVYNVVNNFFEGNTSIKWPNDILVNEKKIAGILIETTLSGELVKGGVIGIGININEEIFPTDLPEACSFYTITNKYYDIDMVFKMLFDQVNLELSKLKLVDFDELRKDYEPLMFGLGVKKYFRTPEKEFEGTISGINSIGQLCIDSTDGPLIFNNKEIAFDLAHS